jgi:hypothetical protein
MTVRVQELRASSGRGSAVVFVSPAHGRQPSPRLSSGGQLAPLRRLGDSIGIAAGVVILVALIVAVHIHRNTDSADAVQHPTEGALSAGPVGTTPSAGPVGETAAAGPARSANAGWTPSGGPGGETSSAGPTGSSGAAGPSGDTGPSGPR